MSTTMQPLYRYPQLDDIEHLEGYRPGGYHPVSIGDIYCQGRFRILHKLGSGGSSTVWLAQDLKNTRDGDSGSLVSLKVLTADLSFRPLEKVADIHILKNIHLITGLPGENHIQVIQDHFFEEVGTPIIYSQYLTSSNVHLRVSPEVLKWNEIEIYRILGSPRTDSVLTLDGSPPGPSAPPKVVAPIDTSRFCSPLFLEESAILHDFGQSFFVDQMPKDYEPATPVMYLAPESYFDNKVSFASDVWALGCVIFETQAGQPFFEPFLASINSVLKEMVEMLGRFPDPWGGDWEKRLKWFDDSGEPKPEDVQKREGILPVVKSSIHHRVRAIGAQDDPSDEEESPMFEKSGRGVTDVEVELLIDLLEKMLEYRPEDRIAMKEVMRHPWFRYSYS